MASDLCLTLDRARAELLARRNQNGHWTGFLSTSALSTATAVVALHLHDPVRHREAIGKGLGWLVRNVNADGGWGDTTISKSNINTTSLCYAALACAPAGIDVSSALAGCQAWLGNACGGSIDPAQLIQTILACYGKDRTFSTPILTLLALTGRLGERQAAFGQVPQLPFELAAFPRSWFKFLRLQVVSYALPALIAIGQNRHHHRPTRNPVLRWLRNRARRRTLRLLERIQPSNGGFLEAIPLTCFVVANLCGMGQREHPVVTKSVSFIYDLLREDGGWPIDTNLATWITTLSVQTLALGCAPRPGGPSPSTALPGPRRLQDLFDTGRIRDWLLAQQFRERHPFTDTPPGGISWTALPGAVPDADDTPGALLALDLIADGDPRLPAAAAAAITWLLDLQNRDGGMPTFCKGWGALPFDQSAADITSHCLAAMQHWRARVPPEVQRRIDRAIPRLIRYLQRSQRPDGCWVPLWFGNEHAPGDQNPTYGTSRCLAALARCAIPDPQLIVRALRWLLAAQQEHGGWSGTAPASTAPLPASLEETGLATDALLCWLPRLPELGPAAPAAAKIEQAATRGVAWLIAETRQGTRFPPHPIGFYFAKLWYYESTYPLIFTLAALERYARLCAPPSNDS